MLQTKYHHLGKLIELGGVYLVKLLGNGEHDVFVFDLDKVSERSDFR